MICVCLPPHIRSANDSAEVIRKLYILYVERNIYELERWSDGRSSGWGNDEMISRILPGQYFWQFQVKVKPSHPVISLGEILGFLNGEIQFSLSEWRINELGQIPWRNDITRDGTRRSSWCLRMTGTYQSVFVTRFSRLSEYSQKSLECGIKLVHQVSSTRADIFKDLMATVDIIFIFPYRGTSKWK